MTKRNKATMLIVDGLLTLLAVLGMIFLLGGLEWQLKVIGYACIGLFGLGTPIFMTFGKLKLAKSCFALAVFTFVVLAVFFILNFFGLFESFSDLEYLKKLILDSGAWGVIVCVLIQLLQVVVLPAPGWVFYIAVTAIYGPVWAFVICYLSTILGSIIAFYIGKRLGKPAVEWCIGKEDTEKYLGFLLKKGKVPFVLMELLPFFPDDILCMVAGLTGMSYRFFITTIVLIRPIYIAFVCFLGTGNLIPFSGWGIPVWVTIFGIIITVCALYFKHQDKVDCWLKNALFNKTK